MSSTDITDITVILDRSGSMGSIQQDTIDGFNEFLQDQKEEPGRATITLIQFNEKVETIWDDRPIEEAFELDEGTFVPAGLTALYDAVGQGIQEAKARVARSDDERTPLYVIVTDGIENSSTELDHDTVEEWIEEERDKGHEFIFLAANQDAMQVGSSMGIDPNKSLTYAANSEGTDAAYMATSQVVSNVRGGNLDASYTDEDRTRQAEATGGGNDSAPRQRVGQNVVGGQGDSPLNKNVGGAIDSATFRGRLAGRGYFEPASGESGLRVSQKRIGNLSKKERGEVLDAMTKVALGSITDEEARDRIRNVDPSLLITNTDAPTR